ncbi:MAG: transglycosylase domain-containing protein [Ktedonobacteraceae bacterium]|nr:transglycosylase domain-containing protein [Ktedonobacteraceae bacterium]
MSNHRSQTEPSTHEEMVSPPTDETKEKDTHALEQAADTQAGIDTGVPLVENADKQDITLEATQVMHAASKVQSLSEGFAAETTVAALKRINKEDMLKPAPGAAKLPKTSRAAAAQRMGDIPPKVSPGISYEGSHHRLHDSKWYLKRHWKRKNLRSSRSRDATHEHEIIKRVMLPIGISILLIAVLSGSIWAYATISIKDTNARYQSKITTLADILPKDNLKMYDQSGHLLYQATGDGVQTSEPLDKIAPNLQNAEIDIEDQYFWQNDGYDITGIVRAAISDLSSGHIVAGGSTITQQLIKNTLVGNSDTGLRKLDEIELAPQITRYYTKQQILNMYLNTVYYANGAYGAEAAAQLYFGLKDKPNDPASNQLDIAQAAMLAGIPSNPQFRDPISYPQNSRTRTQQVLQQMLKLKTITNQQYTAALAEIQKPNFVAYHTPAQNSQALALSSFTVYALSELAHDLKMKASALLRSGLTVTTTVNANLQTKVLSEAQNDIAAIRDSNNVHNSSIVMINPKTGAIETLIGNIDPAHDTFNVAAQGFRQAGSTMKAFTYVTAFAHGVSPGQKTNDKLQTFYYDGVTYTPDNYAGVHHGWITYRQALDWSLNIDAVRLELSPQVGVPGVYATAENAGLGATNGQLNETFTLGAMGVHLLNETSAYGTFANGGVHVAPHAINTVKNQQGTVVYTAPTTGKRAISAQAAYVLTNVLADNATRDKEFFPCDALDLYVDNQCGNTVIPAAVKTGTTNDFVDNLTIGYTPDLVTGVWSGNNDNSPMYNIIGITGAGTIWHDAMMTALQGQPVQQFAQPAGVTYNSLYRDLSVTP